MGTGAEGAIGTTATRVAVIDIGTNSTRLLVADVADAEVREVERDTRVTRLGRGVDLTGQLSAEAIEDVCEAVGDYIDAYRRHSPDAVVALATSAVRDASNGHAFVAELRERFALDARLLDGDAEARLTYRGATAGRAGAARTLVCDIGGGSTELCFGAGERLDSCNSLQVGVVRHSERHIKSDPPDPAELEALASDVRSSFAAQLDEQEPPAVELGIAVAGTPTSLAAIDLELDPYDPERVHGHRLRLERVQNLCSRLAAMPLESRRELAGLHPHRASTIVAGTVILIQVMRAFALAEVEVSERDILHGAALEAAAT